MGDLQIQSQEFYTRQRNKKVWSEIGSPYNVPPHKKPTSSATEILLTTLKHPASHVYLSLARTAYLATNGHHQ